MDYKNTLNLPRADFPMRADLVAREPGRLKKWEAIGLYRKIQAQRAGAEKFVLHDGPPFANGDVHIGTALNKILKDIIVKYKTLRGFSAPYIPGWDCHGLPIEFKVSQEMGKKFEAQWPQARQKFEDLWKDKSAPASVEAGIKYSEQQKSLSPEKIRSECEKSAKHFIEIQRVQFKRLGVLGDWDNPYLTFDKEYEAEELRLFADIVEQGFVYRGKKPVYWSIPCRTALAEAEVEYQDHVSPSIYVKFPVVGRPKTFVLIWTTTPWTLPANLAVAYNSTFLYVQVRVGDENYILFRGRLPAVAEKCGWSNYEEKPFSTGDLSKLEFQHPFCNRTGKLFAGDAFVTSDTGTGFVHIAPGHGLDDYNLGLKVGLPIYSPVTDHGTLTWTKDLPEEQQMPDSLIGKSLLEKHGKSEANEAVLHELRVRHALLHQEDYHHSYPHCWRSKTPIIFRAMDQWFIEIDHVAALVKARTEPSAGDDRVLTNAATFRTRALAEIDRVTWIPDWGVNRIKAAVESRPDWCISRQRTWGVPIPAFYDAKGEPILDAQIVRNAADLIEQHGSNVWFEKSAAELWSLLKPKNWKSAEAVNKSNDTLDVWIDSGSSSRSVLMRRAELQHNVGQASSLSPSENKKSETGKMPVLQWQSDMYLEGSDQHRGWFQSSLLLSLAGNGAAPFKTVLTHGFMVDADREKISKSKQHQGGYEKPQTAEAYVKKWGADIVRLWVSSQDFRNDIIVSEERIAKVAETYRVIRNALRYQLSNLYDFDPIKHTVPDDKLTGLDRWILRELAKREALVNFRYSHYDFHIAYQILSQFTAVELSSIYHDAVKDRLYTDAANFHRRRSTQTALYRLVQSLCKMLSPIIPFTAEEAWEFIPGKANASVLLETWDTTESAAAPDSWDNLIPLRDLVLPKLEAARQSKIIGKALEAKLLIRGTGVEAMHAAVKYKEDFRELLNVSKLDVEIVDSRVDPHSFLTEVIVAHADGQKCERCWHWETDVGSNPEHPTICGRCVGAVLSK
ncbi:MAG: isoleucine--tRNA ligase [Verrucomicrobiota bacterium]|jgi:isoleucyl-tRNA synthetase